MSISANSNQFSMESADQLREEKSFRQAAEQFKGLLENDDLSKDELREIQFKFADSSWRTKETIRYEDAIKVLKELIESDDPDRWWAEASESLADHHVAINQYQHQEDIKQFYSSAREYWAGSKDIKLARERFIDVTFKLGDYISKNWGWNHLGIKSVRGFEEVSPPEGSQRNSMEILYEDILKVVKSDEDKAKVYYSLGMSYFHSYYHQENKEKALTYFNKIIKEFPTSEWADDSYFQSGQYYQQKNEFHKALEAYHGLLKHFRIGESQFVNNAKQQIKSITDPQLQLVSSYTYLPGSEVQLNLNWRNVSQANVNIFKIDLTNELKLDDLHVDVSKGGNRNDHNRGISNYQEMIKRVVESNRYKAFPSVASFRLNLKNEGKYLRHADAKGLADWRQEEHQEEVDLKQGILEPGAYLVLAGRWQCKSV